MNNANTRAHLDVHGSTITASVLTVSDRCSRDETVDTSGPMLERLLSGKLGARIVASSCVPDEKEVIARQLRSWALEGVDLILTTGGTGLGPRDVTPEATAMVIQRRHPGLLELARLRCSAKTPRAFLSRGEAGTIEQTLIVNLPGSPRGASEFLEAMLDILPHAIQMLRGSPGDHEDTRPSATR